MSPILLLTEMIHQLATTYMELPGIQEKGHRAWGSRFWQCVRETKPDWFSLRQEIYCTGDSFLSYLMGRGDAEETIQTIWQNPCAYARSVLLCLKASGVPSDELGRAHLKKVGFIPAHLSMKCYNFSTCSSDRL